ncbi:MAG: hypothetical protein FNT29_07630 [Halothiobacillaceae bacterium]|nr:MAG: hypothetical protein FNT29_07630 [Halothiobacillaceae bacterium]
MKRPLALREGMALTFTGDLTMSTFPMLRACAVLLAAALPALAAPPADPAQADAPVPALEYSSAFDGYTSFRQAELADWRGVNDAVGTFGGHMGHLPPAPDPGHAGHGMGHTMERTP